MKIFVLEDNDERSKWFVKTFEEDQLILCNHADPAIEVIKALKFDVMFLDHDLGGKAFVPSGEPNTGWQVAKVIPTTDNKKCPVIVHSWNPDGAKCMVETLKSLGHEGQVTLMSFGIFDRSMLNIPEENNDG